MLLLIFYIFLPVKRENTKPLKETSKREGKKNISGARQNISSARLKLSHARLKLSGAHQKLFLQHTTWHLTVHYSCLEAANQNWDIPVIVEMEVMWWAFLLIQSVCSVKNGQRSILLPGYLKGWTWSTSCLRKLVDPRYLFFVFFLYSLCQILILAL